MDYKPNSNKYKEEQKQQSEKKVQKVVSGTVKTKKKNEMSKFKDVFISEDAGNVKNYIVMDVLIPAMKKAISDIVRDGIDMILYGESGHGKKRSDSYYVSYDKKYRDRDRSYDRDRDRVRRGYSCDDIIIETRGEAEEVLTRLDELIETYHVASVADLYDLVGLRCEYTDNKYGWTNIRNAEPVRVRDGYMLKMPKALPID